MSAALSAVERIAATRVAAVRARLAEAVRAEMPGATIEENGDAVTVSGRGVRDALRWPAGLIR